MIALIGRARTLWAIAAPVARPLLASAVIGWGLATLGAMADERRENLADLDGEVSARLGELQQYHRDLAVAEQLAHDYSRELARLRAQLEHARADAQKIGIDEGTPDRPGPVAGAWIGAGPAESEPAPVATEPGCQHDACVLTHPHTGPAYVTPEAAERDGLGDAIDWERLTRP